MDLKQITGIFDGRGFDPTIDTFPPLNVDRIERGMRLEKRGASDAKAGVPKTDAENLSHVEQEVVARVDDLRKKGLESYELQVGVYAHRIRGARADRANVELMAGQLKTAIEVESRQCANHLDNAMESVKGSYQKLEAYQKKHATIGPPDKQKNAFYVFGIISIIFLVEVLLSGTLFAEKHTMGLIGGMGIAIIISFVNVTACLLCGIGVRYVNLKSFGYKIFGSMTLLLFLWVFAGLNLTVAHFRDALELYEWDEAAFQAITSLRHNPIGIDSFKSLVVAAFGAIVSIISFFEGLVWNDRHPGFNRTYNAATFAVSSYARNYEKAHKQLDELYSNARDDLKGHAQKMRASIQSALDAVGSQSTLVRQRNVFLETCDRVVNQLHARYRDANVKARRDKRPKYFDQEFRFEKHSASDDLPEIDMEEAKIEIEKIEKIVEMGVDEILKARKNAISAFPTVIQLRDKLRGGGENDTSENSIGSLPNEVFEGADR